jgi:uncharacterized membrane protein YkoI
MKKIILITTLTTSLAASSAGLPCSIHPKKGTPDADLASMTKVAMSTAKDTALKAVNVPGATVTSSELEAERGCLIYSFDVSLPGKKAIAELAVDAGTGKVLSRHSESAKAQANEAAADKAESKKP